MDEIDAALDFKNVSIVACYIYVSVMEQAWHVSLELSVHILIKVVLLVSHEEPLYSQTCA